MERARSQEFAPAGVESPRVAATLGPVNSSTTGTAPAPSLPAPPPRSTTIGRGVAPELWPYVALFTVLILWGLGPPLSKLITAPPLTASFLRLWTSTIGIAGLQMATGARPSWLTLKRSLLGGVAFGLNSLFFFIALKNASIATITVIGALQPGLVMLLASRIFAEKVTARVVGFTGVAICGAAMAVLGSGAQVETNTVGILCSIGSLLCMSVYFLASKKARVLLGASEYVMGVMLWASITVTPVIYLGGGLEHFDTISRTDVFWLIIMLIGPGVGGQLLMGWALRWVPVTTSAMILLGSTAIAILAAWPIHGEVPTVLQLLGGAIALLSVGMILNSSRS